MCHNGCGDCEGMVSRIQAEVLSKTCCVILMLADYFHVEQIKKTNFAQETTCTCYRALGCIKSAGLEKNKLHYFVHERSSWCHRFIVVNSRVPQMLEM